MLSRAIALAASGLLIGIGSGGPVAADFSSWFSRSDEAPAKKTRSAGPPKQAPQPSKSDASRAGGGLRTTVPPTGEDAAYIAFDQGQYLTALKLAEEAAARGEVQANTLIARIYAGGLGVTKDEVKAFGLYSKAADLGDIAATFELGVMLAQGRGAEKNREAAGLNFEKAARAGHAEANYNLGLLFLTGDGKPENAYRAFEHIRFAAEKGVVQAQYDLAALYQNGKGTDANAAEAARWLSRAAERGLPQAQYDYAVLLLKGFGLTKDEPKALGLLKAAAESGIAGAQNRLAYLHIEGVAGAQKDAVEAAKWRLLAMRGGLADPKLDDWLAKLDKAQQQKAEMAAQAWADRVAVAPAE